jgi:molybdopterin-guanine dinucleotide biosynthesis protein A
MADRDVTGVLLVGGASSRFGSPKALASLDGELLGERGYRVLSEAFERVMAVGKEGDALPLPFPVFDDGSDERAPIVGVAAALRLAETEVCVVLPTDMPFVSAQVLRSLAEAIEDADAAVVQTGPLPGAYRRSALSVLERRIAAGELALREAVAELEHRVVDAAPEELRNVNTLEDLRGAS